MICYNFVLILRGFGMQNIDKKEIDDLLTIIPRGYPALDIFHLTDNCAGLCQGLYDLIQAEGYGYDLHISDEKYYEHISKDTDFKTYKFDFKKHRYNRHARQYDYVFIMIALEEIENSDLFYKKLYAISKNAGKVFFIVEKHVDLRKLEDTLIVHNYVATNPIENTFEDYQILSAQKMHGWDN